MYSALYRIQFSRASLNSCIPFSRKPLHFCPLQVPSPHLWKSFQQGIMEPQFPLQHAIDGSNLTESILQSEERIVPKLPPLGLESISDHFSHHHRFPSPNHPHDLRSSLQLDLQHNIMFRRSAQIKIEEEFDNGRSTHVDVEDGGPSYRLRSSTEFQGGTYPENNVLPAFAYDSSFPHFKNQFSSVNNNTVFSDWYANSSSKPSYLVTPFELKPSSFGSSGGLADKNYSSVFMGSYEHPHIGHQDPPATMMNSMPSWSEDGRLVDLQSWSCGKRASEVFDSKSKKRGRPRKGQACEHLTQELSSNIYRKMKDKYKRDNIRDKFTALVSLINPLPSKLDRVSIVESAINYIVDLQRRIEDLQERVRRKRRGGQRNKLGLILEREGSYESCSSQKQCRRQDFEQSHSTFHKQPSFSSWFQTTSEEGTHVETCVVNNEVSINLAHKNTGSCLPSVRNILDEHNLQVLHVNGAKIGDYSVFTFKAKIAGNYCVQAREIANKLLEAVEGHCA